MTLNMVAVLFAGSVWLLAAVLAWPAGHPAAAVALLAGQAGGYLAAALWAGATGRPTINVRIHGRREP